MAAQSGNRSLQTSSRMRWPCSGENLFFELPFRLVKKRIATEMGEELMISAYSVQNPLKGIHFHLCIWGSAI
jgi:hypothetical protein